MTQITKSSLQKIVSKLNEGLIIRTDNVLSYGNDIGLQLVEQSCQQVISRPESIKEYIISLTSLDFLTQNMNQNLKDPIAKFQEDKIQDIPLFKIYRDKSKEEKA